MKFPLFILAYLFFLFFPVFAHGQNVVLPTASPLMEIQEDGEMVEMVEYSGSGPVISKFQARAENYLGYIPYYEWRFYMAGKENEPYLIRYDEQVDYTFKTSGTTFVQLYITFVNGTDTVEYEMDEPFSVTISESKLELPNAFSPNGDGQNDIYKVKEGYQSIISFHAYIYNRWGKRLYEWTDIDGGWDGKYNGTDVKEGTYFCLVKAVGADGRKYEIKRDVNLLRGFQQNATK